MDLYKYKNVHSSCACCTCSLYLLICTYFPRLVGSQVHKVYVFVSLYKYKMYIVVVCAVPVSYIRLYALISPGRWVHKFIRSMCLCPYTCSFSHLVLLLIVHLYALFFQVYVFVSLYM